MKAGIVANEKQQKELELKPVKSNAELSFARSLPALEPLESFDCFFYLPDDINDIDKRIFNDKPVFINDVLHTLRQNKLPSNFHRINGWNGFLQRELWEIASNYERPATTVFEALGWKYSFVKDEPGLVAAKVISMIVNEAFYALGENVSSEEEIDMAMKLGTNYPYGPFEWAEKIGIRNIYNLLHELALSDRRYAVSPLLQKRFDDIIAE